MRTTVKPSLVIPLSVFPFNVKVTGAVIDWPEQAPLIAVTCQVALIRGQFPALPVTYPVVLAKSITPQV